jgi:hypothetical protein
MSLLFKAPPRQVARAHQTDLGNFVDSGSPVFSLLLQSAKVCTVHSLRKADVCNAGGDLTRCVSDAGWRFLAGDSGDTGATHVGSVGGSAPKLTGFSGEPKVADAIARFTELEQIPQLQQSAFEVRFLRVPWLRFEAFWLHVDGANDSSNDYIVPYTQFATSPQVGLNVMQAYGAAAFLNIICHPPPPPPPAQGGGYDAQHGQPEPLRSKPKRKTPRKK